MRALTRLFLAATFCSLLTTQIIAQSGYNANPFPDHTNCQREMKQAGLWYFGVFAGIDFTSGNALAETSQPDVFQTPISPAVIADSSGNILFMTTGKSVYNKNFNEMASGLFGHFSCTQPAIIIPKPGSPDVFFIITSDSYRNIDGDKGLNYTVVDMSLNYGQGNIVSMNNNLIPDGMDGRLTAVKHANGEDYWLISHKWGSAEFCVFRISSGGIDANFVSSTIGSAHSGNNDLLGFMKSSPDGNRLAVTLFESKIVEFFNFNRQTGQVSSANTSPSTYDGIYGLEFSQDNSKAYITTLDYANFIPAFPSELIQFDLTSSDIFGTATSVAVSTDGFRYAGLQLGIDGRIYMAKSINTANHSPTLGVIYKTNREGMACNFHLLDGTPDTEFSLGGNESFWGLPNVVQSFVDYPHFLYDSICIGDMSIFSITNQANIEDASWDFNDAAGTSNTANYLEPTHVFSDEGQYQVSVTETYGGIDYTYTESVSVWPLPEVDFGMDTIYIFKGDAAKLSVGDQYSAYLWSTGSTNSEIFVSSPGQYWVEVQNYQCCYNVDSVYVVQYELYVPNAFRPSSPINYEFKPVVPFNAVQDYHLMIFDRWGQMIFESKELGNGWDGEIRNQPAPFGVYAWRINYNTISEDGTRPVSKSGSVMLLR